MIYVMIYNAAYLIIIFVHAGIISLKDEFFLEVHVTFILDVFREPLFWAVEKVEDKKACFVTYYNNTRKLHNIWLHQRTNLSKITAKNDTFHYDCGNVSTYTSEH